MSKRPKLIFHTRDYPNFNEGWILPLVQPHFEMTEWDPAATYDRSDTVLTTFQRDFEPNAWFRQLESQGHKVVVDHLFDSDVDTLSFRVTDHKLDLRSPHWMWYRTALLMTAYDYNNYRPAPQYTHDFLCLMNKLRDHRDRVMTDLAPELAHARWSYVERGQDIGDPAERNSNIYWGFYNNPEWYNTTCWSLIVESYMRGDPWFLHPKYPNYRTEISEKSYKPLAYYHPFVVVGSVDTLKFLHSQGFETFDNLWDESYDSVPGDADRLNTVLDHVRSIVPCYNRRWLGWDSLTQQKLAHNHHRFFDLTTVRARFEQEIIGDIQEFLAQ